MTGTGPRRVVIPAPDRNARGHLCPVDGYLLSLLLNIVGERHLEWLTVKGPVSYTHLTLPTIYSV